MARAIPGLTLNEFDLPLWGLSATGYRRKQPFVPALTPLDSNLDLAADMMQTDEMPLARLMCMVRQADAWDEAKRFSHLLALGAAEMEAAKPTEILLNVRTYELFKARHPDCGPIPLGFIKQCCVKPG